MKILIDGVEVLLVRDAAKLANKSNVTIYNWVRDGFIQSKQHNEQTYVVRESLEQYLESRNSPT